MKGIVLVIASIVSLAASSTFAFSATKAAKPAGWQTYGMKGLDFGFPANNLHLLDDKSGPSNITKEQFNQIIDDVIKYWQPVAKAQGVTIVADKAWDDSTVNASAFQSGKTWYVNMYGGLARRPEVTPDGFALVVCHELGHHFAGYTFGSNWTWASNEGQADYFATHMCAKVIWGREFQRNEMWRRAEATPAVVEEKCKAAWGDNSNAQGWCVRASAAGMSLATLLGALGGNPNVSYDTPDKTRVSRTNNDHPQAQCRLDTYFAGALCTKRFDINVIPGKNHASGQISVAAENEAMKYTCFEKEGFTLGTRPLCWFKPLQ